MTRRPVRSESVAVYSDSKRTSGASQDDRTGTDGHRNNVAHKEHATG